MYVCAYVIYNPKTVKTFRKVMHMIAATTIPHPRWNHFKISGPFPKGDSFIVMFLLGHSYIVSVVYIKVKVQSYSSLLDDPLEKKNLIFVFN